MCVVVSLQSYTVRTQLRVRQQHSVKSPLLLSTLEAEQGKNLDD